MKFRKNLITVLLTSTLILSASGVFAQDESNNKSVNSVFAGEPKSPASATNVFKNADKANLAHANNSQEEAQRALKKQAVIKKYKEAYKRIMSEKDMTKEERQKTLDFHKQLEKEELDAIDGRSAKKNAVDLAKKDVEDVNNRIADIFGLQDLNTKELQEKRNTPEVKEAMQKLAKSMQMSAPLNLGLVVAVETAPGNLIFVNENGRFIFKGEIYDTFNNMKSYKTVKEIREYAQKTNYKKLQLDPETLSSARIGDGEREVVIYVDASSNTTKEIIDQVTAYPDKHLYTFYFVPFPADSKESQDLAYRFYCAREEGNPNIGTMLYQGTLNKLKKPNCNMNNFKKTFNAAYFTQVNGLPFFVDYDGTISRGIPAEGLYNWLTSHRKVDTNDVNAPDSVRQDLEQKIISNVTKQAAELESKAVKEHQQNELNKVFEEEEEENYNLDSFSDDFLAKQRLDAQREETTFNSQKNTSNSTVSNDTKAENSADEVDSETPSKEYTTDEITHAPFNVKNKYGDLNGFDMSEEIYRYQMEAKKSNENPLVVNGSDENSYSEIYNDVSTSLNDYLPLDVNFAHQQKKNGTNRNLILEIEEQQEQLKTIQNKYIKLRQYEKDKYDRKYNDANRIYNYILSSPTTSNEEKARKITDLKNNQAQRYKDYQTKLAQINEKEQIELKAVVDDINYLKGSLQDTKRH